MSSDDKTKLRTAILAEHMQITGTSTQLGIGLGHTGFAATLEAPAEEVAVIGVLASGRGSCTTKWLAPFFSLLALVFAAAQAMKVYSAGLCRLGKGVRGRPRR